MGKNKRLEDIYYDPTEPASYTAGSRSLFKQSGKIVKGKRLSDWLKKQETWSLHKPIRYKFKRRQTLITPKPHRFYQVDLLDTSKYSADNKDVKFLLTAIDVFTKFAWAIPLKNKTGLAVAEALKRVIREVKPHHSLAVQSDKGREFKNKRVQDLLKSRNIRFYTTENDDIKASVVERFNRTLQAKMHRYMTSKNTFEYLPALPGLLAGYNRSVHSTTGFSPEFLANSTDARIHQAVWGIRNYVEQPWPPGNIHKTGHTFKIGDYVRINKTKIAFRKSYIAGWSKELFKIKKINLTAPVTYQIEDQSGEEVLGNFYSQELLAAPEPEFYDVEAIVKKRKKNKSTQYLVKWVGYPDKYNSWVDEKNLKDFR